MKSSSDLKSKEPGVVLVMVATEVEEVGKGQEELMMRWFSGEFFSDTDQLEPSL